MVGTNLLKSMDKVGCEKILFSSSATVYGIPKYLPYDENHVTEPMNVYGRTKLIVEDLIKSWTAKGNKSAIALRYFNPAGANRSSIIGEQGTNDPKNLFPILGKVLQNDDPSIKVFGNDYETFDGTGIRDYIHISDLASAHVKAINYLRGLRRFVALNVGMGKGTSVLEIILAFEKLSGKKIKKVFEERRKSQIFALFVLNPSSNATEIKGK